LQRQAPTERPSQPRCRMRYCEDSRVLVRQADVLGEDLCRPECVLCTSDGTLFCSDARGGIMCIPVIGRQRFFHPSTVFHPQEFIPNGFTIYLNNFLIANIGSLGGLWRMSPHGAMSCLVRDADGIPLTAANHVHVDDWSRIWVTCSTRRVPRD